MPPILRREVVAWTNLTKEDFAQEYWDQIWHWYNTGGDRHVAAYLKNFDLSNFNPKAPPPKTPAFWDIVDVHRAPEDAYLADVAHQIVVAERDARVVTEVESTTARRAWQSLRSRDAGDRCRAPIAPLDAEAAWHGSL
jgi:hypothetical protein